MHYGFVQVVNKQFHAYWSDQDCKVHWGVFQWISETLLAKGAIYMYKYLQVQFGQIQQITSSALPEAYMEMNWWLQNYWPSLKLGFAAVPELPQLYQTGMYMYNEH